jgi:tetratricopeptide (TPR) repeat protein
MRSPRTLLCLALGALLAAAAPVDVPRAHARDASSRRAERQRKVQARALFAQAEVKYNLGQFAEALDLYSKAYEVLPLPGFLFNIGQCHRNLGRPERAIFFYQGYLRGSRKITNREVVERLIGQCQEAQRAAEAAERVRRQAAAERAAREAASRQAAEAAARRVAEAAPPEAVARPPRVEPRPAVRRPVYRQWWFWATLAAGVAAVATGVGVGVGLRPDPVLPSGSLGTLDAR